MKRPPEVMAYLSEVGRLGGRARARVLSRKRRQQIGRKGAKIRWAKHNGKSKK